MIKLQYKPITEKNVEDFKYCIELLETKNKQNYLFLLPYTTNVDEQTKKASFVWLCEDKKEAEIVEDILTVSVLYHNDIDGIFEKSIVAENYNDKVENYF